MRLCLSSPLYCLSLSVCPWVQCQRLIKDSLWFSLNDQGEETGSSVITEHWCCINFNLSTICGCHTQGKLCTPSDHLGSSRAGFIDHERYPCIFHEGEHILWSKVPLAQIHWLPWKTSVGQVKGASALICNDFYCSGFFFKQQCNVLQNATIR